MAVFWAEQVEPFWIPTVPAPSSPGCSATALAVAYRSTPATRVTVMVVVVGGAISVSSAG